MDAFWSLASMAGMAFVSATILPGQSEAVFLLLLSRGEVDPVALLVTASVANSAGSVVNWWLGRLIARGGIERLPARFRPEPRTLRRAERWFERFGWPSLLFSWLPLIGDPLTIFVGTLGYPLGRFTALVLIGKTLRYGALWAGWSAF
jgi:membrane protein YqaA with SNARE-associated domain